jgi:uncharacterized protein YqeY
MGRVMAETMKRLKGQASGERVRGIAEKVLGEV